MLYRLYLCDSLGVRYSFFFFSGWSCLLFGFRLYYCTALILHRVILSWPFFSMFENINQINQSACCRDIENGQTLDDDHLKISKYWKVSTKYWNVPVNKEYKIVCCNIIGSIYEISNIVMNWLTNQLTTTLLTRSWWCLAPSGRSTQNAGYDEKKKTRH